MDMLEYYANEIEMVYAMQEEFEWWNEWVRENKDKEGFQYEEIDEGDYFGRFDFVEGNWCEEFKEYLKLKMPEYYGDSE